MNDLLENEAEQATDHGGPKKRKIAKSILGLVIVVLLAALGLEVADTDFDLGNFFSNSSPSESVIEYEADLELVQACGDAAKDEYSCDDFFTQEDAQAKMDQCIADGLDVKKLDDDSNGIACEELPSSSQ